MIRGNNSLKKIILLLVLALVMMTFPGCELEERDRLNGARETFELTVSISGEGDVIEPGLGSFTYDEGAIADLKAEPAQGWEFEEWLGAVGDPGEPETTILMDRDRDVTAVFKQDTSDDDGDNGDNGNDVEDPPFSGEIRAHFINVGQGDAILIKAVDNSSRRKLLIDAGQSWQGRDRVVPYLQDLGIETIHLAVATHPHADHIGGFQHIFDNFEVLKIVDSGYEHDTQTYRNYLADIEELGIELVLGRAGMKKELAPGLYFEILNPVEPLSGGIHYNNIVGQLRYDRVGFMLTGDIEAEGEGSILDRFADLENQILKVAHHGSSTSSTEEFLEAVNPEVAIIQAGLNNQYGHPHEETIERLLRREVEIYRTDHQGDIVVVSEGLNWLVNTDPYVPDDDDDDNGDNGDAEGKININTASYEELQEITGVGPVIAQNIIDYREKHGPFQKIEDIMNVSGIGEARFEAMKDEIIV